MLPYPSDSTQSTVVKVYFNPKFKNVHINPKFIQKTNFDQSSAKQALPSSSSSSIYVNPRFLEATVVKPSPPPPLANIVPNLVSDHTAIFKSRRKLIRKVNVATGRIETGVLSQLSPKLIKIGQRKLIRKTLTNPISNGFNSMEMAFKSSAVGHFKNGWLNNEGHGSSYNPLVSRYRLKRVLGNENLTPTRVLVSNYKLRRIGTANRSIQAGFEAPSLITPIKSGLLNINGVLYKSTPNKLQKSHLNVTRGRPSPTADRVVIIRGEKFHLDGTGKRLRKTGNTPEKGSSIKRIDIGGLTYVAKGSHGTLERTNFHIVRNHLTQAKQKSITILANRFKKSNIPCLIYRKLGRCLAQDRGKCCRVHDPHQVAVCPKFLKGNCDKEVCLLSHKTCLSKMPVCKFYLEGLCSVESCPYLHKKVSGKAEICQEFLKGFCPEAERCAKRHEKSKQSTKTQRFENLPKAAKKTTSKKVNGRYYKDKSSVLLQAPPQETEMTIVPKRPTLSSLPAFIPIG